MTRQDDIELTREDIRDKARGFCSAQIKIIIRTKPSTKYPKGAKYEGYVFDVTQNSIIFNDTFHSESMPQRIHIYLSEIASPSDLYEKENVG